MSNCVTHYARYWKFIKVYRVRWMNLILGISILVIGSINGYLVTFHHAPCFIIAATRCASIFRSRIWVHFFERISESYADMYTPLWCDVIILSCCRWHHFLCTRASVHCCLSVLATEIVPAPALLLRHSENGTLYVLPLWKFFWGERNYVTIGPSAQP